MNVFFLPIIAGFPVALSDTQQFLPGQDSFSLLATVDAYLVDLTDILGDVGQFCQRVDAGERMDAHSWYPSRDMASILTALDSALPAASAEEADLLTRCRDVVQSTGQSPPPFLLSSSGAHGNNDRRTCRHVPWPLQLRKVCHSMSMSVDDTSLRSWGIDDLEAVRTELAQKVSLDGQRIPNDPVVQPAPVTPLLARARTPSDAAAAPSAMVTPPSVTSVETQPSEPKRGLPEPRPQRKISRTSQTTELYVGGLVDRSLPSSDPASRGGEVSDWHEPAEELQFDSLIEDSTDDPDFVAKASDSAPHDSDDGDSAVDPAEAALREMDGSSDVSGGSGIALSFFQRALTLTVVDTPAASLPSQAAAKVLRAAAQRLDSAEMHRLAWRVEASPPSSAAAMLNMLLASIESRFPSSIGDVATEQSCHRIAALEMQDAASRLNSFLGSLQSDLQQQVQLPGLTGLISALQETVVPAASLSSIISASNAVAGSALRGALSAAELVLSTGLRHGP